MELSLHSHVWHGRLVPLLLYQGGQREVDQLLFVLGKQSLQQDSYALSSVHAARQLRTEFTGKQQEQPLNRHS